MRHSSRPPSLPSSYRLAFQVLESNPYILVRYEPSARFVLVTRRPVPYPSIPVFHQVFDKVVASLEGITRQGSRLLIDTRDAPARNDEEFESALAPRRAEFLRGYLKIAFLVRTLVGKLQVARHAQQDGVQVFIGSDIAEIGAELGLALDEASIQDPARTV